MNYQYKISRFIDILCGIIVKLHNYENKHGIKYARDYIRVKDHRLKRTTLTNNVTL